VSGPGSPPDDPGKRLEEVLAEHRDEPTNADDATEDYDPLDPFAPTERERAQTGEEADPAADEEEAFPEAPLFSLLGTVAAGIGVHHIDHIWIFPPRRMEAGESAVIVVSAFTGTGDDRRRVYAAHYTAHDESPEPRLALAEYGTAPTGRVDRLVEEVVERIKDGPAGAPRGVRIDGNEQRWHAMLHELAEQLLERARKDPRLRP
jgi:hypothetical protein